MTTTVIISGCESIHDKLAQLCTASGLSAIIAPNIYHLPENDPVWSELESIEGDVIIVSPLYPRPAEWLFRKHWSGEKVTALNISDFSSAEECHGAIIELSERTSAPGSLISADCTSESLSDRWYPVIDRSRCVNCHNCLQFCLFGVYETVEGEVTVCNPDSCKPGCPACSRICPEGAIMFPLCIQSAAIAGAPGLFMSPDAAARRMFYARTKKTCPVCGSSEDVRAQETAGAKVCEECGRPIVSVAGESSALHDELDQLIDDLDSLTRKEQN